jgi:hypothetical protein
VTSLYLVGGLVVVIGILIFVVVRVSKSSGRTTAERNSLKLGESLRGKFDAEIEKRPVRGKELLARLRSMGKK